jgi:hypothetical protein
VWPWMSGGRQRATRWWFSNPEVVPGFHQLFSLLKAGKAVIYQLNNVQSNSSRSYTTATHPSQGFVTVRKTYYSASAGQASLSSALQLECLP